MTQIKVQLNRYTAWSACTYTQVRYCTYTNCLHLQLNMVQQCTLYKNSRSFCSLGRKNKSVYKPRIYLSNVLFKAKPGNFLFSLFLQKEDLAYLRVFGCSEAHWARHGAASLKFETWTLNLKKQKHFI